MRKTWIILSFVITFAAGAVSGWVVGAKVSRDRLIAPPRPGEFANYLKQRLKEHLQLSPEQEAAINPIIDQTSAEMRAVHDETMTRLVQIVSNSNQRVAAQLTPEQCRKFEAMEKERQERDRKRFKPRGRDHGRPPGPDDPGQRPPPPDGEPPPGGAEP